MPWSVVTDSRLDEVELVVCGPGPGDPRDAVSPRIRRMREVVRRRRASGRPLLAVCLSHQILADSLGLDLAPLARPHQGLQKSVDVFGTPASIGFYNTFTARVARARRRSATQRSPPTRTGDVYALRGPGFASVQGHLESILSRDGMSILELLVAQALTADARALVGSTPQRASRAAISAPFRLVRGQFERPQIGCGRLGAATEPPRTWARTACHRW